MKKSLIALLLALLLLAVGCSAPAAEQGGEPTPGAGSPGEEAAGYQADVVIIGAGGAGMAAAIQAVDNGASVVILEKMDYAGGNTIRSEGGMNAAETVFQKEKGIEDTVETMIEDTMTGGYDLSDPELVQYLAENSAATVDWLTGLGMDLSDVGQGAGATFARMHRPADGSKIGGVLVPVLMENLESRGITVLYGVRATELVETGGAVTGVVAVDHEGSTLTFAANAVVMATGGFGANEELFVQYRPDLAGFTTTNHPGATGDGIVMAQAVGADVVDMDQIQTNPTVELSSNIVISESVRGLGAIFINQAGERFVNEMLTRDVLSSAILELPEQYTYLVFDQAAMDSMAALQENYERGIVLKGEDVAGLAEATGVDAAVLEQSLADWNAAVAAGVDGEFGRETGMDADLSHPPYYAIKVGPAVHYTMGGIKINTLAEVIDTEGAAIPGLYAAGEVTGGVHGGNRLGGNAVADIMVFGRQAGMQASQHALGLGKLELVLPETDGAAAPEVQGDYTDGTYTGSAQGRNGAVGVEVVVSGGSITAITVTESSETEAIFASVERDLIPEIIRTQSLEVDTLAGATISCQAVLDAVAAAIG